MSYADSYIIDLDIADKINDLERLKNKSVLITGSSGLIGSCIVDMIQRANIRHDMNIRTVCAGRSLQKLLVRFSFWKQDNIDYVEFDNCSPSLASIDCDYIIHCASNAHPKAYAKLPVETAVGNIYGTNYLLEYASRNKARFLYVSSSEVYGEKSGMGMYSESDYHRIDPLEVRSCYPCSKRMAENLCAIYRAEYGVDYVIARPGHVYGPTMSKQDTRAHAQFARQAACGESIVMKSDGSQLRSYCYVVDCASAILHLLLHGVSGEAYNISNSNSIVSIREMADCFARAGGVDLVFETPSEEEASSYNPMSCSALSSEKIEKTGWKGSISMNQGAEKTLDCLRSLIEK